MHPEPLFHIFGLEVHAYGICMAVGILLCFLFLYLTFRREKFNEDASDIILLVGIFAVPIGILFAVLFQNLYDFIDHPATYQFSGRMTFLGGLIGGVGSYLGIYNLYVHVIAPKTSVKWLKNNANAGLCDALPVIPIGICIAHAFGRLGCFFAGCCAGGPTNAWYGLPCSSSYAGNVVPVQLFECLFLLALGGVMAFLFFRFRFEQNFGVYAIGYGVWRFCIEFARGDDRGSLIGSLSPSQFWCIVMVLCGIGYFFLYRYVLKPRMKHPYLTANETATSGGGELQTEPASETPASSEAEAASEQADKKTNEPTSNPIPPNDNNDN